MRATILPAAIAALLPIVASACASLWGFQDSTDSSEGGTDGSPDSAGNGGDEVASSDRVMDAADAGDRPCSTTCLPPPASAWTGPYEIFEGTGTPAPSLPGCDTGAFTIDQYDGVDSPDAPSATCTCTCNPPTGATCSAPVATFWGNSGCSKACGAPIAIKPSCTVLSNCSQWTLGGATAEGGACTPSVSTSVPAVVWTRNVRLCATASPPSTSGCDGGAICVPDLSLLSTGYCVAKGGTGSPCPPGYPVMKTYYVAGTDMRDCTTCSCGAPSGISCAGATVSAYGDTTCTTSPSSFPAQSGCSAPYKGATFDGGTPTGGSCAPEGGSPTGVFTPTTPTTICCTN